MIDYEKLLNEILTNTNIIEEKNIPGIDMYMDQVTTFMDKYLKDSKRFEDDKILTKTMINNYAKNDLLPPPTKKRYSRQHIIMLIFIYYFKSFLSINDIKTLLSPISDKYFDGNGNVSIEEIYNNVCDLELSLKENIKEDIVDKIQLSKTYFEDESKKDRDFLQLFMLINSLSYDVYIKKQMIESIVDKINSINESSQAAAAKREAAKEAARKEAIKKEKEKRKSEKQ